MPSRVAESAGASLYASFVPSLPGKRKSLACGVQETASAVPASGRQARSSGNGGGARDGDMQAYLMARPRLCVNAGA